MDEENKLHYANSKESEEEKNKAKYNLIYTGKEEFEEWKQSIEQDLLALKVALNLSDNQIVVASPTEKKNPTENNLPNNQSAMTESNPKEPSQLSDTNSQSSQTQPITQIKVEPEPLKENAADRRVAKTKPRKRQILGRQNKKNNIS